MPFRVTWVGLFLQKPASIKCQCVLLSNMGNRLKCSLLNHLVVENFTRLSCRLRQAWQGKGRANIYRRNLLMELTCAPTYTVSYTQNPSAVLLLTPNFMAWSDDQMIMSWRQFRLMVTFTLRVRHSIFIGAQKQGKNCLSGGDYSLSNFGDICYKFPTEVCKSHYSASQHAIDISRTLHLWFSHTGQIREPSFV